MVIISQLSKQAIFVLIANTIILHELAKLFVIHVFFKCRILSYITSDCRTEFVSNFFRSLEKSLDIRLHFTSRYHSERDNQTECTNQTLKQYFYIYYNYQHDNWLDLLLLVEFVYNNIPSVTTGVSLFFANKSYYPNITIHLERDIALSHVHKFVINLNKLQNALKTEISVAQQQYQQSADVYRIPGLDFSSRITDILKLCFSILCNL